jgi:hypothetical protein
MPNQLTITKFSENAMFVNRAVGLVLGNGKVSGYEEMKSREGAYFCVTSYGVPIAGGLVGTVPDPRKREKYDRLSREKCHRLAMNRKNGHKLSRDSLNEAQEQYAGAIAGALLEFSFSGYLAEVDEVAAGLLAVACGDLHHDEACRALRKNGCLELFAEYFVIGIDNQGSRL